jgi:hypothetical protein
MKASNRYVVALMVCTLAGIGAFGCGSVKNAGKNIDRDGNGVRYAAKDTEDKTGHDAPHTITATADEGGSITPSGRTLVPCGSSQIYIATANAGYKVADVMVDGQSVGPSPDLYHDDSSSYTFDNVNEDHEISATFGVKLTL